MMDTDTVVKNLDVQLALLRVEMTANSDFSITIRILYRIVNKIAYYLLHTQLVLSQLLWNII